MVKLNRGPAVSEPNTGLGIIRFFDVDTSGPKLSPEFVIGIAIALIALVLIARALFG